MFGPFFAYTLKAALCLLLFFPFYKLLLSKESFHRFNRIALISLMLVSFALPFFQIDFSSHEETPASIIVEMGQTVSMAVVEAVEQPQIPMHQRVMAWVILIYIIGMCVMIVRDAIIYTSLAIALRKGRRIEGFELRGKTLPANIKLIEHDKNTAPFSWMNYIVVNAKDLSEAAEPIIAHEMGHVRHHHTLDLLFTEVCLVFQWFNPAMWLMRQELQAIHEFEADEEVLDFGVNAKQYQLLIIKKAAGSRLQSITNSLHHSSIKKRIAMMLKEKSNPWAKAKYLFALPVAAFSVALFATPKASEISSEISECKVSEIFSNMQGNAPTKFVTLVVDAANGSYSAHLMDTNGTINSEVLSTSDLMKIYSEENCLPLKVERNVPMKYVTDFKDKCREEGMTKLSYSAVGNEYTIVSDNSASAETQQDNDVFTVVEQQAEFPGGGVEMMAFIAKNLKYPESCSKAGIQGRVTLSFIVEKDGSLSDFQEIRSPNKELTAAAIDVMKAMPKWTPGKQRGQVVRVKYVVPVTFRLQGDEAKTTVAQTAKKDDVAATLEIGKKDDAVFTVVEEQPEFPGGERALMEFVKNNLKYPESCVKDSIQGRVTLSFVVDRDGSITDIEEMRSPNADLTTSTIELIKSMPKWKPGKQRGQNVRVKYVLPITYRLE